MDFVDETVVSGALVVAGAVVDGTVVAVVEVTDEVVLSFLSSVSLSISRLMISPVLASMI